jgi:endonuclease/exonuclease/phosphatase family metal-dependent hydrolase
MARTRSLLFFAFLLLFGGGFLALMYANRGPTSPPPPSAVWSPPDRPVRIASYNILHNQRGIAKVVEEIRKLEPDFVLLQEVERGDLSAMTQSLSSLPAIYHASENLAGGRASWGNAILSKHRLYEAGSIPNPGGGSFGVWGTAVVDGKKFVVANVHLSATWNARPSHLKESGENRWKELSALAKAWQVRGSPPIVIGGDFNQIAMGNNYSLMTRDWSDVLASLGKNENTFGAGLIRTRIDYFLVSKEWKVGDGGVVQSEASDHRPIWMVGGKK